MRRLRAYCDGKKPEFVLIGEMIHGDYNRITADGLLHSVTNYEWLQRALLCVQFDESL